MYCYELVNSQRIVIKYKYLTETSAFFKDFLATSCTFNKLYPFVDLPAEF